MGSGCSVGPHRVCGPNAAGDEFAVGHRPIGAVGADLYPIAGLGTRMVIAREPRQAPLGCPATRAPFVSSSKPTSPQRL